MSIMSVTNSFVMHRYSQEGVCLLRLPKCTEYYTVTKNENVMLCILHLVMSNIGEVTYVHDHS